MFQDGQRLGEFEILGRIGQGGMGAVYKARQVSLRRTVAIKTLQAALAADEEYIVRFHNEAAAAAALNHPNLVQVYSAGESDGLHWFAMEYVEGESAQDRVKRKGRIEPVEAIAIVMHVATALEYGWNRAQLIHRDIKPDNIFLSTHGEVKLGDLGLAKVAEQAQGLTVTGASMGTPHYVSPEQAEGKKDVDLRADIYSLGCTLFHLLSGKPPYAGDSALAVMMKHVTAPVPDLRSVWPECPAELATAVMKMMQKRPAERQQTYGEVNTDLRRAYDLLTGATVPNVIAVTRQPVHAKAAGAADPSAPTLIIPAPDAYAADEKAESITQSRARREAGAKVGRARFLSSLLPPLALVAVILAIVAFFATRKREPRLTDAERAAKDGGTRAPSRVSPAAEDGSVRGAPTPPAAEPWVDLLQPGAAAKLTLNGGASVGVNGLVVPVGSEVSVAETSQSGRSDGALRFRARYDPAVANLALIARNNHDVGAYGLYLNNASVLTLQLWGRADRTFKNLITFKLPTPLQPGQDYQLELRVVGSSLTARLNGETVGHAEDATFPQGGFALNIINGPPATLQALEYLDLSAAPAASATPATERKDAPFENSLHMKLVPVPITGGPTNGQRVLFSVWDTRVQDYQTFAKETKRDWSKPLFEQGPTHPAVNVSWEDAQAFCKWLTDRERKAGMLGARERYRLPSDHEWSCAAGIGDREDAALLPEAKKGRIDDVFPWGGQWPPPDKTANIASEELRPILEAEKIVVDDGLFHGVIQNYHDGYAFTSPVESFAPNSWGLYDMGGNVQQWCEDWNDKNQKRRALRGASFATQERPFLLSSNRPFGAPASRYHWRGFRVVLASLPSRTTVVVPASPAVPAPKKDAPIVNSLGMKFVPVPITGGPTNGKRMLFSIWETRVQDYEVFATETNHEWQKPDYAQGPTHPVVMVSWDEAQAFCQWLTERERKAGKLGANERYRLPSDHEWSCAAGLGKREDPAQTPEEKGSKIPNVFPWGSSWPPPPNSGNYSGEEAAGHEIRQGAQGILKGYRDGFPYTSPVGSFPADSLGLFDLSGNVSEWCEDRMKPGGEERVFRTPDFSNEGRVGLCFSYRFGVVPGMRRPAVGFRCVLAPDASAAAAK